jgi:hypothetical protein
MPIICSACQHANDSAARVCLRCGTPLRAPIGFAQAGAPQPAPARRLCPKCDAALDADARFCPSCRASVSLVSGLADELRTNVQQGVGQIGAAVAGVPRAVWAVVIQCFWLFVDIAELAATVAAFAALGMANSITNFGGGLLGQREGMGWAMLLAMLAVLVALSRLAFDAPLIYGFLAGRQWAPSLYLWSCVPRGLWLLVSILALLGAGVASGSLPVPPLLWLLCLGALLWLQFNLVRRSREEARG